MQNTIKSAYIDASQIEVAQGLADHSIIAIPFGDSVGEASHMNSMKQAYDYFSKIINMPIVSKSGTQITNAILAAYDYVIAQSKANPDLRKANILFLTDGEDSFSIEQIIDKRKQIQKEIDLSFTTINIVKGNSQFEAAEKNGEGLKAFGAYSYRHINDEAINQILDSAASLEMISDNAMSFIPEKSSLSSYELALLAQSAGRLSQVEFDAHEFRSYIARLQKLAENNNQSEVRVQIDWNMILNYQPTQTLPEAVKKMYKLSIFKALVSNIKIQGSDSNWEKMIVREQAQSLLNWLNQ